MTYNKTNKLIVADFGEGIELCSTYFSVNKNFYCQIFGTVMGTPISATIANVVMEHLDLKPTFFKRYFDDCILCDPVDEVSYVFDKRNSCHPKLQFTVKKDVENKITFVILARNIELLEYQIQSLD